jgi:hypothetical protein
VLVHDPHFLEQLIEAKPRTKVLINDLLKDIDPKFIDKY